jgi:hypothetical protein
MEPSFVPVRPTPSAAFLGSASRGSAWSTIGLIGWLIGVVFVLFVIVLGLMIIAAAIVLFSKG